MPMLARNNSTATISLPWTNTASYLRAPIFHWLAWTVEHAPLQLETSRPGVFGVGDVRSRSVKRVATAIGEGSMAVRLVFDRLQATGVAVADPARASAG